MNSYQNDEETPLVEAASQETVETRSSAKIPLLVGGTLLLAAGSIAAVLRANQSTGPNSLSATTNLGDTDYPQDSRGWSGKMGGNGGEFKNNNYRDWCPDNDEGYVDKLKARWGSKVDSFGFECRGAIDKGRYGGWGGGDEKSVYCAHGFDYISVGYRDTVGQIWAKCVGESNNKFVAGGNAGEANGNWKEFYCSPGFRINAIQIYAGGLLDAIQVKCRAHRYSNRPTTLPTAKPSAIPISNPTAVPVANPTQYPIANPTQYPIANPTQYPIANPTQYPISNPTQYPIANPTQYPIANPTAYPISDPTQYPIANPTAYPIANPTAYPIADPTAYPISDPTAYPVSDPTAYPISDPTSSPVTDPTASPVSEPTITPVSSPTDAPVADATAAPVADSTDAPVADTPSASTGAIFCPSVYEENGTAPSLDDNTALFAVDNLLWSRSRGTSVIFTVSASASDGPIRINEDKLASLGLITASGKSKLSLITYGKASKVEFFSGPNFTGESYTFSPQTRKNVQPLTSFHFKNSKGNDGIFSAIFTTTSSAPAKPCA